MNIGYEFKNESLLKLALTHTSYANEKGTESNQRLEFLGDSILSFVIAEYIYENFKEYDEGKLTEMRASVVCERSLAKAAEEMKLDEGIIFGRSEAGNKPVRPSILCDTYESVLGAIYLDSDIETVRKWILDRLIDDIMAASRKGFKNYKSEIQSFFQKRDKGREVVEYEMIERKGPDHNPSFKVKAMYKGEEIGTGVGSSRKAAEQEAAKEAYYKFVEYDK